MRSTALKNTAFCLILVLTTTVATGQESDSPDESTTPATGTEATETVTDEQAAESDSIQSWDRLIYVPFRELQKVLDGQNASAVLPYQQYLDLIRHYMQSRQENAPTVEAVLTRSTYEATVEKDVVRVQASLQLTVLREKGWARIPLNFGAAAVGELESDDDSDVLLNGLTDGKYELLVRAGAGQEHTVRLQLLTSVKTSPESRSFELQCPPVAISELSLTLPEPEQAVEISPLQILLPVDEQPEGKTVVQASLGATDRLEVRWNPRAGAKPVMDLLTSVTNQTSVRIEPGLLQSTATFNYEVLRGELTEVEVHLPPDARVIDVTSANGRIGNWKPEAVGETHQKLNVELLAPVRDRFQLTVQTERNIDGETIQLIGKTEEGRLRGLHAQGVVRESGQLSVTSDASLTTLVQDKSGVQRIDSGKSESAGGATGQTWKFSGRTGTLVLEVRPVEPRLLVRQAARVVFENDQIRLQTRLSYTVERAGVFQLELDYPESLTIESVRADGMTEFNTDQNAGRLTLSLARQRQGTIHVDITAHQPFDATVENDQVVIPVIKPLQTEREDGRIVVYAPRSLNVSTVEAETSGLFPANPAPEQSVGRAVQVASWQYSQQPVKLTVQTSVRPAQLTASIATTATVEPKRLNVQSLLQFTITNAGIDTLRVAVPEPLADRVTFRATHPQHRIQQSNRSPAAEDGWVTWTLILQDEIVGTVAIEANWVTPLSELEDQEVQSVRLEPIRVLPPYAGEEADKRKVAFSQPRGEIRLLRHESLSISATGEGETMEAIDVRELQLLPQDGFIAFRYFNQPVAATIELRKHEIHEVVETVVSRAAIEVVTDYQPLASVRARFRLTTSERQRLRVDIPVLADLQAPLLNDRRTTFEPATDVTPAEGWDAYYVNITREGAVDEAFLLTLQYQAPVSEDNLLYERQGGRQILRLPTIGNAAGGTVQQETRLAVWSPQEITFVGEPEDWSIPGQFQWNFWNPLVSPSAPDDAGQLSVWIGDRNTATEFAEQGQVSVYRTLGRQAQISLVWWNRPFLVAVISAALLIAGFILRHTSWENRLTLVIVAAVAVAVWTMQDTSEALQFVSAGSLALVAVAGIWVVSALTGSAPDTDSASPDSTEDPSGPPDPQPGEGEAKSPSPPDTSAADASNFSAGTSATAESSSAETRGDDAVVPPPGTVTPSPDVRRWMDEIMKGQS